MGGRCPCLSEVGGFNPWLTAFKSELEVAVHGLGSKRVQDGGIHVGVAGLPGRLGRRRREMSVVCPLFNTQIVFSENEALIDFSLLLFPPYSREKRAQSSEAPVPPPLFMGEKVPLLKEGVGKK